MRFPTITACTALALGTALVLGACTSTPDNASAKPTDSSSSSMVNKALAAKVPASIRSAGVITVAIDPTYAPFESIKDDAVVGLDADLATAIGQVLGLKVEFKQTSFDAIIPALQAKDADMALSSIGDSKVREEVVDFATAYWNGTLLLVKKGNPKKGTPELACGMNVGVIRGSLQQTDFLPAQDSKCLDKGKKAPVASIFASSNQAALALQSSRVDAVLADAPTVLQAAAASNNALVSAGPIMHNPNPAGVAFTKGSGLTEPVSGAINVLIKNGSYDTMLKKWHLDDIGVKESTINGALS